MRVSSITKQFLHRVYSVFLQKVVYLHLVPLELLWDVVLNNRLSYLSVTDLLQFEIVALKLRRVHLAKLSQETRHFVFVWYHQNVHRVFEEDISVTVFQGLVSGGIVLKGQIGHKENDFDGSIWIIRYPLSLYFPDGGDQFMSGALIAPKSHIFSLDDRLIHGSLTT